MRFFEKRYSPCSVVVGSLVFALMASGVYAVAQSKESDKGTLTVVSDAFTPQLSTEQKQAIQILAQRIELAQLRAQAAATELSALLKSLHKDGYELNLETLAYVKKPPPSTAAK